MWFLSIGSEMNVPIVMILSKEGFWVTKLCHSDLSIFPSWSTSASKNVCLNKKGDTNHVSAKNQDNFMCYKTSSYSPLKH
ncbi:hypothetical protein Hanom_Chr04g00314631 [Helianthus anomalus]